MVRNHKVDIIKVEKKEDFISFDDWLDAKEKSDNKNFDINTNELENLKLKR